MTGHTAVIFGVAYSPDGKLVATGGRDLSLRLWDAATGKEVRKMTGHRGDVFGVAFSPDGQTDRDG